MRVLAIESSCDDTAAAVLDGDGVRSSVVASRAGVAKPSTQRRDAGVGYLSA